MNLKYNSYKNRIRAKKVNQYDLQGNFIKSYSCSVDAEKELRREGIKINAGNIRNVCNGKRNKAGNYRWKYAD